jgi:hypothetical protein
VFFPEESRFVHGPMLVDRAGKHVIYDEYGGVVKIELAHVLDRHERVVPRTCVVIYDTFELEVSWMRQHLILTFDVGGEWELALLDSRRARMVVAWGNAPGGWSNHYAQDIPACQVADLPGLIKSVSSWVLRYSKQHLQVS